MKRDFLLGGDKIADWGGSKGGWGGHVPPSLYVKRGPDWGWGRGGEVISAMVCFRVVVYFYCHFLAVWIFVQKCFACFNFFRVSPPP
jgi:hypothetical protein